MAIYYPVPDRVRYKGFTDSEISEINRRLNESNLPKINYQYEGEKGSFQEAVYARNELESLIKNDIIKDVLLNTNDKGSRNKIIKWIKQFKNNYAILYFRR